MRGSGRKGLAWNPWAARFDLKTRDCETCPVIRGNKEAAAWIARPRASTLAACASRVVRLVSIARRMASPIDSETVETEAECAELRDGPRISCASTMGAIPTIKTMTAMNFDALVFMVPSL